MADNADDVLSDLRRRANTTQIMSDLEMKIGAIIMIEALKADRLIPDNIDKVKAATEAIRRHDDPMSKQTPIGDMWRD